MLSKGEKLIEKKRIASLPAFDRPINVRLKFRKVGSLQYISHLDLQRTFMRVIVRACIPAWYTKGFNPHAKLVFSTPLSVGSESEYEFLDIRIDKDMPPKEIMDRLNAELTDELRIVDAYIPETDFSEIAWCDYEIRVHDTSVTDEIVDDINERFTANPIVLPKKTKSGIKDIDIIPMIKSIEASKDQDDLFIKATLKANVGDFLNPEMLVIALKNKYGILESDGLDIWYSILRVATRKADLSLFR